MRRKNDYRYSTNHAKSIVNNFCVRFENVRDFVYINIDEMKEKSVLLNIRNTHPDCEKRKLNDSKYPSYCMVPSDIEKQIQGATCMGWYLNSEKIKKCDFVFAVINDKICGVFKLYGDKTILCKCVKKQDDEKIIKWENYPPYRCIELELHNNLDKPWWVSDELFELVKEEIPIPDNKDLDRWQKRKFLLLNKVEKEIDEKYMGKHLLKNGSPFRFHSAVEYINVR